MDSRDTVFALASARGRAGIAVFRLSGPAAGPALATLSGKPLPEPRKARLVRLGHGGEAIDDGIALWFPGPASFTGEDVAELHVHGGRAVAAALAEALLDLGLRPAEAGEFSRRAFLAGKLDLTRAEAIADLVEAETAAQRRQALRQLDGGLMRLADGWRERLIRAIALTEAAIDFSDEGIPDGVIDEAATLAAALAAELTAHLSADHRAERLRDGIDVAILGAPNAGKSSLLNAIAGRDVAIVSETAGTTRDVIEVHLDLGGWPVVLADTAGLREAAEAVEAEGIRRALARAEAADLKLAVFDGTRLPEMDAATRAILDGDTLVVVNKSDLAPSPADPPALMVSARTGEGLDGLLTALTAAVASRFEVNAAPALTRARHRAAAAEAAAALGRFDPASGIELAAEELRRAAHAIGRLTGRVEVDEVLDVVFGSFCIGK
ncbi:tRNA uridine-5-carboxymethylaminomethyl(34) synthesis GTPase MnmE [Magnetospirillum sp. UT-4]|uniref:tRNA uridine-5-carboxymethylaminomethyl(34) synthesis GTPase MnmE n=1 Tax=Magnetospirillum sp. UT-4 TaxID=2681467 RepID=UPI001384715E|nr:tRNA uridine-5-carboxymethylaminomethyl(34) synthesis GTPase MnmE [Magnetospirillum sp. UT-4]CAA7621977.1 tRNA modification GTPase MnmE [Magnetospirillum sp. UT-4]